VPRRAVFVAPMIDVTSYGQPFIRMLGGGQRIWTRFVDRVEHKFGLDLSFFDLAAMADEFATPPLLIVHDRDDQETGWDASRALAGSWPDARLLTTTGSATTGSSRTRPSSRPQSPSFADRRSSART
jgi:hypothetical protein